MHECVSNSPNEIELEKSLKTQSALILRLIIQVTPHLFYLKVHILVVFVVDCIALILYCNTVKTVL